MFTYLKVNNENNIRYLKKTIKIVNYNIKIIQHKLVNIMKYGRNCSTTRKWPSNINAMVLTMYQMKRGTQELH